MNASRPACLRTPLRTLGVALACAGVLALSGCSSSAQQSADAIRQGLSQDLQSLADVSASTGGDLMNAQFAQQLADAGVDASAVYGALFAHLTYSVDGVDVSSDGTTATAHLTVTNRDMSQAFANYQSSLADALAATDAREEFSSMRSDDSAFTAYLMDKLTQAVSDESLPDVTTSVDVTYTLKDGVWTADDTSELRRAVLGGLDASQLASAADAAASAVASSTADAAAASVSAASDAVTLPAPEEGAQPVVTGDAEGASETGVESAQ